MFFNFCRKNWQIFIFNIVLFVLFLLFYGRFGDVYVDCFREAYIPSQVIKGDILYKDIFTIYAPFSYLFNAFLYLIFGIKLKVLYLAGFLATVGILNVLYKISNKFTTKTCSLGIVLFGIAIAVLSPNVFNMIFPYSYGILYGLFFILLSIYFVLIKKFPAAYLMYAFAVCSKYEFVLLLPLILWAEGWQNFKTNRIKNIVGLFIPFIITWLPLFLSGMNLSDLLLSFELILKTGTAKTINYFYSISGLIFSLKLIPIYLMSILKFVIPIALMNKLKNWFGYISAFLFLIIFATPSILIFLFPLITILFLFKSKQLSRKKKFIIASSLLVSIKVFWAANIQSYGTFFLPLGILALFIVFPRKLKKQLFYFILMISLIFGCRQANFLKYKNIKISTDKGIVYSYQKDSALKDTIEYINNKNIKDDIVAVYPECLAVNFFTNTKSDNKFYSLIPLYAEIFGDDIISGRIDFIKPKYIILNNYDTSNYYYSEFGQDYLQKTKEYILNNYVLEQTFNGVVTFYIYRKSS